MKLHETGAYIVNGCTVVEDNSEASAAIASMTGTAVSKEEAAKNTIAYGILKDHNTSGSMEKLKIICWNYPDSQSIRTGKVSNSLCTDQLS